MNAFKRSESGAIAIAFAVLLIPVMLVVALTVDYGRWLKDRMQMQNAADAAVRAGVAAWNETDADAVSVRRRMASYIEADSKTTKATIDVDPRTKAVSVTLESSATRTFSVLGSRNDATISVSATGKPGSTESGLVGKHIVGYQGWFDCPARAAPGGWSHWFRNDDPKSGELLVDMWPEVNELSARDLCDTGFKLRSGGAARVFSSGSPNVVDVHLSWMRDYAIDGLAVQRFVAELDIPRRRQHFNAVLDNVRAAAEKYGRTFFIMYDLSDADPNSAAKVIERDLERLSSKRGILGSSQYTRHGGRPLIGLWGLGFNGRKLTPEATATLIRGLRKGEVGHQPLSVLGGVPAYWREGKNDASAEPGWSAVYAALDVISPWTVGRYSDAAGFGRFVDNVTKPDLAWARAQGTTYLPVVFPGFSWANLKNRPEKRNEIPRRCGAFYRAQTERLAELGVPALYTAMFDEVDEGTAIFKLAPRAAATPAGLWTLPLDADGCALPSDWYLQLARDASRKLQQNR